MERLTSIRLSFPDVNCPNVFTETVGLRDIETIKNDLCFHGFTLNWIRTLAARLSPGFSGWAEPHRIPTWGYPSIEVPYGSESGC